MRFVRQCGRLALFSLAALRILAAPETILARHHRTEAELQAKIEREHNPVKKAKIEIDLGHLKMEQAASAFDHDDASGGTRLLDAYLDCMQTAWKILQDSGREATKKPQGFMALDIALRENSRFLFDLQQRTPYEESGPIARVARQADALHTQVLAALFPGGKLEKSRAKHLSADPQASALRPSEPPQ
jgi:hypothetical protein